MKGNTIKASGIEIVESAGQPPLAELFPVKRAWNLTAATGVGSLPGTSAHRGRRHGGR